MKNVLLVLGFLCVGNGVMYAAVPVDRAIEKDRYALLSRKTKAESDFERSLVVLLEKAEAYGWDQNKTIDACIELSREYGIDGWKFKQVLLGLVTGFVITGGLAIVLAIVAMDGVFRGRY